tara:strand:- start:286 stop:951 length:666 start_codon:yes stop_codon:yes gene_type:complete
VKNNSNLIVIWDWNGTLVDDAFLFVNLMNSYLLSHGLPTISLTDYRKHFCFPVSKYYKSLGFCLSEQEFRSLSLDFIQKYRQKMFLPSLVSGAKKIVLWLYRNKYKQFLVSAQEQSLLNQSVQHYRLVPFFGAVLGLNNNFAISKKDLLLSVVRERCTDKDVLVVIGDTLHDYEVAASVNAACCLVSYGHNSKARLQKTGAFVANNLGEVRSFLQTIIQEY